MPSTPAPRLKYGSLFQLLGLAASRTTSIPKHDDFRLQSKISRSYLEAMKFSLELLLVVLALLLALVAVSKRG